MENKDEMNLQNQEGAATAEDVIAEEEAVVEEVPLAEEEAAVEEAPPAEEETVPPENVAPPEGVPNPEGPPDVGMGYAAAEELKAASWKKPMDKRKILEIVGGAVIVVLLITVGVTMSQKGKLQKEFDKLSKEHVKLQTDYTDARQLNKSQQGKIDTLTSQKKTLEDENEELKNGAAKQLVDVKNAYEKGDWKKVIELAGALHEKYNGKEEDKEAQALAAESQKKIDEAKAAKEAEEAKGYETGITYDQLSRTPDDFKRKKVKFYGKVVQVIEGSGTVQIRLAVDDDYDRILLGNYSSSIVSTRILEDDHITIYGTSEGTISYQSTLGATITIPGVRIDKIDQ